MKKTGQLATKSKNNAVQPNKKNTPKKGLITPKTVQPTGKGKGVGGKKLPAKKGKSVGGKKLPPKKGKNSTKKEEEEPEDGSDLELNNMQEDSVESNGIGNKATNGSDAPDDSSSDDAGISGNARQLFGKILPRIQSTSDDDDDQQGEGEDSEEENEVDPIKKESKQEDDEADEDNEEDEGDEENEDNEEDEENDEGNEQNNEDEDEEDNDGPHEENIKNESPNEGIDLWKEKKGKTPKDKDRSADSLAKLQFTVYVKRLKNKTTEEDIKKHFNSIGEITAVKFEKRGNFPRAVVTFADVASTKAALKMNNTILNDCTILVRHAQAPRESDNKECTILVMNVDKIEKLEGERLEKIFSKVGEVEELSVVCQPNVLAFVTFKTQEAATEALKLDGTVQDDLKIHVKPYNSRKPKTRIFISNISANATEDDLRKMFEPCGQIIGIELKRNQFGATCDLKFNTEESFCKSFLLHEEMLLGKRLNVRPFAQSTIHNKPLENNEPNVGPFEGNKPNSRGSFRGNIPRKTFQKNEPNSGPFQDNKPSSRGSFRGNWQSSRGSFRGSWQSSRGSFRDNRSSSRGSFKGNRPNSGQFNGKRQFPAQFDGQRSQPSDLWESGPPQKKTKIDMTKTQPANE